MAWWFSGGGSKAIINVMSVWQTGLEPVCTYWAGGGCYTEGMDIRASVWGCSPWDCIIDILLTPVPLTSAHLCTTLGRGERVWKRSSVDAYHPPYSSTYPFYSGLLWWFYFRPPFFLLSASPSIFRNHSRNFYFRNKASSFGFVFFVNVLRRRGMKTFTF